MLNLQQFVKSVTRAAVLLNTEKDIWTPRGNIGEYAVGNVSLLSWQFWLLPLPPPPPYTHPLFGPIYIKKSKRKVQGVPQSQTAALPRPQEEEETDKSKQAQPNKRTKSTKTSPPQLHPRPPLPTPPPRTKSTKTSPPQLHPRPPPPPPPPPPKRGNRNTKRTEKHKNKMTQGKTYNKSPRRINHKATRSKTNTGTTALERSVEQTTVGFKALLQLANHPGSRCYS